MVRGNIAWFRIRGVFSNGHKAGGARALAKAWIGNLLGIAVTQRFSGAGAEPGPRRNRWNVERGGSRFSVEFLRKRGPSIRSL